MNMEFPSPAAYMEWKRDNVSVWTDPEIATLSEPGKFLPGLADLMSRKPVWAEDEA